VDPAAVKHSGVRGRAQNKQDSIKAIVDPEPNKTIRKKQIILSSFSM
jgi:hypothetical protein